MHHRHINDYNADQFEWGINASEHHQANLQAW
jgi:hypothetical protein